MRFDKAVWMHSAPASKRVLVCPKSEYRLSLIKVWEQWRPMNSDIQKSKMGELTASFLAKYGRSNITQHGVFDEAFRNPDTQERL